MKRIFISTLCAAFAALAMNGCTSTESTTTTTTSSQETTAPTGMTAPGSGSGYHGGAPMGTRGGG